MYHCHLQFYCFSHHPGMYDRLQEMPPLPPFTHTFTITGVLDRDSIRTADVILADLRDEDAAQTVRLLSEEMRDAAQLIVLAEQQQIPLLAGAYPSILDIWTVPMTDEELRFRFLRWQQRRKLEGDYWETSHFLDVAVNSSPNLIWFKTRDGIHERVNSSFCKTVGKTRDQVEGQHHAYIWGVDAEDPDCMKSDNNAMESQVTCISQEHIQTQKGARILSTYKSPLYDMDGSVMGTVGVALDVTKELAYEKELLTKTTSLERLFTTMDCGVICHSVDGSRIISINQAALTILGYETQEEMEADGFDAIAASVMDEDKPKLRKCIQSLHRANESASTEYRALHKDGKIVHVIGNIKLMEENGEWFYQRFLLDCTAQKLREQAEKNAQAQKIKYQEQLFNIFATYLASNTDDIYLMLNGDATHVEYISPNVERILGIDPANIDEELVRYAHCGVEGCTNISSLACMQPGETMPTTEAERINIKTGEHKWFRESKYCVSIQGEKKIVLYISDRTKERKTRDTLTQALDMAQVASKAKSAFLSSVSHDIRTPMNAIMGFITLLREEAGNKERVLEYTQRIDAASQHLLGLINDVLDMNKIESGIATLNLSEFNLADVIDEINAIIRPQTKAKEQAFDIHTTALANEHLIGDRLRINQILINILSNAVKYTQKGGTITMTVSELPQVVENYCRIQFMISDNGLGMSEAYQKVIFNPFSREQNLSANEVQGTGLGMSITKSLVDLMNGSIKVESQLGKGSTFIVELELRIQEQESDPRFWSNHGVARMIVVDDDEEICTSIIRAMTDTGVYVDYTTEGSDAVKRIVRAQEGGHPYDLILLDWKMPGLNGLETARLIRERTPAKVPILIFTAYDWEEIEEEANGVGINHFLPKPFFMSNFKEAIRRVMGADAEKTSHDKQDDVFRGKHVLVVDDIDVNRLVLVKILSTLGATCDTAENGQQAVDKFEASAPGDYDLIMMDIQMPIMDGYSAARAIRASSHPSAKSIAVVAMTANAFVDDVREALSSGMDAHISKPIIVDKMTDTVRDVFRAKGR